MAPIKSNSPFASYFDFFSKTGKDAVTPEPGPAVYISASGGDTVSTDGDFKVHIFTTPGNFSVSQLGSGSGPNNVDYLVLGGGGGGGSHIGGGGGAGGLVCNHPSMPAPNTRVVRQPTPSGGLPSTGNYAITVGAGGAGANVHGQSPPETGSQGSSTTLNGLAGGNITARGGGGGGAGFSEGQGGSVGSGGGAAHVNNGSAPGPQVSTAVSPTTQGYEGGTSYNPHMKGGGGGGANGAGSLGGPGGSGNGGPGITLTITGSSATFAGGGGGGGLQPTTGGSGGPGGGGGGSVQGGSAGSGGPGYNNGTNGGVGGGAAGGAGGANSGGGGGGAAHPHPGPGGSGGSGIVVIRYKFQ